VTDRRFPACRCAGISLARQGTPDPPEASSRSRFGTGRDAQPAEPFKDEC